MVFKPHKRVVSGIRQPSGRCLPSATQRRDSTGLDYPQRPHAVEPVDDPFESALCHVGGLLPRLVESALLQVGGLFPVCLGDCESWENSRPSQAFS
jgi:hypothetical protein